jgi:hypothetical protein
MQNSFARHPSDDQLKAFLSGKAPSALVDLVELHYAFCSDCVRRLARAERAIEVLECTARPLSTQLAPRKSISQDPSSLPNFGQMWPWLEGGAVVAATLVFGIALSTLHPHGNVPVAVVTRPLVQPPNVPHESAANFSVVQEGSTAQLNSQFRLRPTSRRAYRAFQPPPDSIVRPTDEVAWEPPPDLLLPSLGKGAIVWEATYEIPPYPKKRNPFRRVFSAVARAVSIL